MVHPVALCVKHLCLQALTLKPIPTLCFQIQFALEVKLIGAVTIQKPCFVTFREPGIFNGRGKDGNDVVQHGKYIWPLHLIYRKTVNSICCVLAEGTLKTLYLKNNNLIGLVSAVGIHHFVQQCNVRCRQRM